MINLSQRNTDIELMDDPGLDKDMLMRVFQDINRANSILGGNHITIKCLQNIFTAHARQEYTVIDVGCGDGSMLRAIARYFKPKKIKLKLIGLDIHEKAIEIAREQSKDHPEISYAVQDVLSLPYDTARCDILLCTLTMHHFSDAQIPIFLKKFCEISTIGVVINDLQRSGLAYYLFKVFSAIFIQTKIAKHDGPISIRSGFTRKELVSFSRMLPGAAHKIQWKWAFRYVWVIRTDRLKETNERS